MFNKFLREKNGGIMEYLILLCVAAVAAALLLPVFRSNTVVWHNQMVDNIEKALFANSSSPPSVGEQLPPVASTISMTPKFDGINDYFKISKTSNVNFKNKMSAETLVYVDPTQKAGKGQIFLDTTRGTWVNGGWNIGFDDRGKSSPNCLESTGCSKALVSLFDGAGTINGTYNSNRTIIYKQNAFPTAGWYHIAVTFDLSKTSNNFKLYLNGNLVASGQKTGGMDGNSNAVLVGAESETNNTYNFKGEMKYARLWSVERTASDIRNNKDKTIPAGSTAGLEGVWDFDNNLTVVNDQSGKSNQAIGYNLN